MIDGLVVKVGSSSSAEPAALVDALHQQVYDPEACLTFIFVSPRLSLERLGPAILDRFGRSVMACASAGEIGPGGYGKGTAVAISLKSPQLRARLDVIADLAAFGPRAAEELGQRIQRSVAEEQARMPQGRAVSLLLVDGLARLEEHVVGYLGNVLGGIPLVGGSAGDDLTFDRAHVYHDGAFRPNQAVVATLVTTHPFTVMKTQHFEAAEQRLVVTGARPEERVVTELDGEPAAEAYARVVGVPVSALSSKIFSEHPVVLRIGGQPYVRSIQRVLPDGSLAFYCAIDEGLVLSLGRGVDLVDNLRQAFAQAVAQVGNPAVVLGFDCIHRRLEIEARTLMPQVEQVFAEHCVVGFNTYGEQYHSVHVNQTFTALALGTGG